MIVQIKFFLDEKYPSRQNNEILINRLMTQWILNYFTDELVKVVIVFLMKLTYKVKISNLINNSNKSQLIKSILFWAIRQENKMKDERLR